MKKNIIDGYLVSIQGAPDEQEYNDLLAVINKKPADEPGYEWKLRADTLEWEGVAIPEEELEEIGSEEIAPYSEAVDETSTNENR